MKAEKTPGRSKKNRRRKECGLLAVIIETRETLLIKAQAT